MKKIYILILMLLMALLIGSCIGSENSPTIYQAASRGAKSSEDDASQDDISADVASENAESADTVSGNETIIKEREIITSKLQASALRLHVYEPFKLKYTDFELENLEGNKVSMNSFEGQVIFLNFWATWCGPCRAEMPAMERVYQQLKDQGLAMVTINLQEDAKTVKKFMENLGLTFPVLLDKTGAVGDIYNASNIPTSYLFDRQGFVVAGTAGTREWDQNEYMEIFKLLLAEEG